MRARFGPYCSDHTARTRAAPGPVIVDCVHIQLDEVGQGVLGLELAECVHDGGTRQAAFQVHRLEQVRHSHLVADGTAGACRVRSPNPVGTAQRLAAPAASACPPPETPPWRRRPGCSPGNARVRARTRPARYHSDAACCPASGCRPAHHPHRGRDSGAPDT
jgi:hypothetical protein